MSFPALSVLYLVAVKILAGKCDENSFCSMLQGSKGVAGQAEGGSGLAAAC